MTDHKCDKGDRILALEINVNNFMERVEEKFDMIIEKLNEIPTTYATKVELSVIRDDIVNRKGDNRQRIQTRGAIIVALIGLAGAIIVAIYNK